VHAFAALEVSDNPEQIVRAWIAFWPQHSHQALRRNLCRFGKVRKSYRRFDVVSQDGLPGSYVAGEHYFNSFAKQLPPELWIALDTSAYGFLEIASERHGFVTYFLRL
jgi:hypothetical protein